MRQPDSRSAVINPGPSIRRKRLNGFRSRLIAASSDSPGIASLNELDLPAKLPGSARYRGIKRKSVALNKPR